jgi:Methyltransferase domain
MIALRNIYGRYFRRTRIANLARWAWYRNWRRPQFLQIVDTWAKHGQQFRYRALYVAGYFWPRLRTAASWLSGSSETSNFTYDLTPRNEEHLAQLLALVLGRSPGEIVGYINELRQDHVLKDTVAGRVKLLGRQSGYDPVARFGRRVGWYALVRAMKPKIVIETGVEKGLGATVLCAALLRNSQEGYPGRYYGTDIDRGAGMLFCEPYRSMGEILYGDSIESLAALDVMVDIFINDSDHSADYEGREYRVIAPKLSTQAVVIGDNAHVTDELLKFSSETSRHFLFFREEPADHWYLGAGIGLSFKG